MLQGYFLYQSLKEKARVEALLWQTVAVVWKLLDTRSLSSTTKIFVRDFLDINEDAVQVFTSSM